jgi:hypothetical protein
VPEGTGIPGDDSWQLYPSRLPVPVQVPHDTSFSPVTLTHFWLGHWVSFEQKQPPAAEHSLVVPLQCPSVGQENPDAVDIGQPPAGQATGPPSPPPEPLSWPASTPPDPESGASAWQTPPTHAWLAVHACAAPQPPQLLLSVRKLTHPPTHDVYPELHAKVHALLTHAGVAVAIANAVVQALPHVMQLSALLVVSTQLPEHAVGDVAGHVDVHAYDPSRSEAHIEASPPQSLAQLPHVAGREGFTHPASHARRPTPQPPSPSPSEPPSPASSPAGASVAATPSSGSIPMLVSGRPTLASHPSVHAPVEYEPRPVMTPHAPMAPASAAAPTIRNGGRTSPIVGQARSSIKFRSSAPPFLARCLYGRGRHAPTSSPDPRTDAPTRASRSAYPYISGVV